MSISPMDLDSSLDDLIRKRKQTHHKKPSNNNTNTNKRQQHSHSLHQQQNKPKSSLNIQTRAKITKPSQPQRSGINSRLSSGLKVSGPLFTSKNQPKPQQQQVQQRQADPSQIIITKAIAPGSTQNSVGSRIRNPSSHHNKPESSILNGRLGKQPQQQPLQPVSQPIETSIYRPRPPTTAPTTPAPVPTATSNFSIRGRSTTAAPTAGLSIKGESGPTLLLVTGLDPGANDDDLKFAFEEFGNILHCEVLRDRHGRSFGEAEIEYSTKNAALDCIARLDNQMADGRFLRVILRENKPKPTYAPPKPLQSVISASSYTPTGKMYADQMNPRYDIRRQ